jgi:hypothetical protein
VDRIDWPTWMARHSRVNSSSTLSVLKRWPLAS